MLSDIKFACRQLAKSPGFASIVVLSLIIREVSGLGPHIRPRLEQLLSGFSFLLVAYGALPTIRQPAESGSPVLSL